MAKTPKAPKTPQPSKAAKGKLSAKQAAKAMHKPDAVLGKHDTTYHNAGKC